LIVLCDIENIAYRDKTIDTYIEMDDDTRLMNIGLNTFEAIPTSIILWSNGLKPRYYHGKHNPLQG
jgi:hypothetical protein